MFEPRYFILSHKIPLLQREVENKNLIGEKNVSFVVI